MIYPHIFGGQMWPFSMGGSIPSMPTSDEIYAEKFNMYDDVNHPPHYTRGKIEVIDFIEDQQLPYHLGNVVKYICRAGHKTADPKKDLEKARWYLNRYIDNLSK